MHTSGKLEVSYFVSVYVCISDTLSHVASALFTFCFDTAVMPNGGFCLDYIVFWSCSCY